MPTKVQAFCAEDGSLFVDEREAARHEAGEALKSWFKRAGGDPLIPEAMDAMSDAMLEDSERLLKILSAYRHAQAGTVAVAVTGLTVDSPEVEKAVEQAKMGLPNDRKKREPVVTPVVKEDGVAVSGSEWGD